MGFFHIVYTDAELPHRARSVYMYLRDRMNGDGECWPGVKTIAADLKLSRRTVQRAVADLVKAGLLIREYRFRDNGSSRSNLYRVDEK